MINKRRITALEAACKRINAPNESEYDGAIDRAFMRSPAYMGSGEDMPDSTDTQQEAADNAIIQAYERIYGKPKNAAAAYERFIIRCGGDSD